METLCLPVNAHRLQEPASHQAIARAAAILRVGGLVAFPTETVYGLGANALDPAAVRSIFAAKERPSWDPVIVHIADEDMLAPLLGSLTPLVEARLHQLREAFWPGPLTLLLTRSPAVPDEVTSGRPLVGIRWPAHPVAQALIGAAGLPIAAPSANRFGHISPTTAQHVLDDLDGRIAAVLDGGPCDGGVESTVLDISGAQPVVYRPGGVTRSAIAEVLGCEVLLHKPATAATAGAALPAPGTGIRHYAPSVPVTLVASEHELTDRLHTANNRAGVMLPTDWHIAVPPPHVTFAWGEWSDPRELSRRLYEGLRALESAGVEAILCPLPPATAATEALRDRLQKAAMPR